jgi:hypothetical protein
MEKWKFIDVIKMNGISGPNFVQNIFCNTSSLLEQPLLLYIIVTGVWSECNICVCYLCTGNWCGVNVISLCVIFAQGTGVCLVCLFCVKY